MRNFSIINKLNEVGNHIGGLGGFLKSLGFLVRTMQPIEVYIVFDGIGSSLNKKNLVSEYKANRTRYKLSNKNIFNSNEDELESKVNQISRLVNYLNCLPIKLVSLDRTEADDVIGYLTNILKQKSDVCIISSDNDFLQLVEPGVTVFRPHEKLSYNYDKVKEKYGILPENYVLYKSLVGDSADNIKGIKDLGPKTLIQKFPEFIDTKLTLENVFEISKEKLSNHVIFARILQDFDLLRNYYTIMDLSNPILNENDETLLNNIINQSPNEYNKYEFIKLYNEDGLNNTVTNVEYWLNECFNMLNVIK